MPRNYKKILILIVLICCGILIFTACSSSIGLSSDEIKDLINSDIDGVDNELKDTEDEAKTATDEGAATLANDSYYLSHRLDDILGTFDKDVEDGYITEDEKRIDELKQRISVLIPDLTTKAGAAATAINLDAKALIITSKEDLDTLIDNDDSLGTGFEAGIGTASSSTKEIFKTLIEQRLDGVESALDDLDKLETDGKITSEEKGNYEKELKELRKRFDDLDYQLG